MEIMPNKMIKKGQVVFSEGDAPDGVYYITEGRVIVSRLINGVPQTITELESGDIFGELAMIDDSPRSATIIAAEDTWLYCLNRRVFEQKLKALDHLMYNVFLRMTLSIRNMNMQLENLSRLTTHQLKQEAVQQAQTLASLSTLQANDDAPQTLAAQPNTADVDTSFIQPVPPATTAADNLSMIEDYINTPRFRF